MNVSSSRTGGGGGWCWTMLLVMVGGQLCLLLGFMLFGGVTQPDATASVAMQPMLLAVDKAMDDTTAHLTASTKRLQARATAISTTLREVSHDQGRATTESAYRAVELLREGLVDLEAATTQLSLPQWVKEMEPHWRAQHMRQLRQRRAIAVYVEKVLLGDLEWIHVKEIKAMHLSWKLITPPGVILDLVLFIQHDAWEQLPLEEWGCITDPSKKDVHKSNCIAIRFTADKKKFPRARIVSIWYLVDKISAFLEDHYKWVFKCDTDTWFGPQFSMYIPQPNTFVTGVGGYIMANEDGEETKRHILQNCKKRNLQHHGHFNTGASWFGPPDQVRKGATLAAEVTTDLFNKEFDGFNKWPNWWKGVALMYGQEMALNHLYGPALQPNGYLDAPSYKLDLFIWDTFHLHAYQNALGFQKFKFQKGEYKGKSLEGMDLRKATTYMFYCTLVANGQAGSVPKSLNYADQIRTFLDGKVKAEFEASQAA